MLAPLRAGLLDTDLYQSLILLQLSDTLSHLKQAADVIINYILIETDFNSLQDVVTHIHSSLEKISSMINSQYTLQWWKQGRDTRFLWHVVARCMFFLREYCNLGCWYSM